MFDPDLLEKAELLLQKCRDEGVKISSAESCTGGLISALLTAIPGSSDVFERGFVAYSNESKIDLLGVPKRSIELHGAVSEIVSLTMAEGALSHSNATLSISVTGIAGPDGGSDEKPVGLVHFGCAKQGAATIHDQEVFGGTRSEIRMETLHHAIRMLKSRV